MTNKYDVAIIGAGFAGITTALNLKKDLKILIIDKNNDILKKFILTGKGRSNITNTSTNEAFLKNIIGKSKILYPALSNYNYVDILKWCDDLKIRYEEKTPTRIHLIDSNEKFKERIKEQIQSYSNITLLKNTTVINVKKNNNNFKITTDNNLIVEASKVIFSTGGKSFPKTGSDGKSYNIIKKLGHKINEQFPIGVGFNINERELLKLQGISCDNVEGSLIIPNSNKLLFAEKGSLIVTHFGISGPLIKRISGYASKYLLDNEYIILKLCFLKEDEINDDLSNNKYLYQCFKQIPKNLLEYLYNKFNINKEIDINHMTKNVRQKLIMCLTNFEYKINSTRDIVEATNTGGGVCQSNINPNTYESKIINNIFLIGEVLDINPKTNGFNLTMCYITARMCAKYINENN